VKSGYLLTLATLCVGSAIIALYLFLGYPDMNIVTQVRIPRLILTLFTGMTLAGIGSIYQLMLANPLAEPYILGISGGSAFGAILFGISGAIALMPLGGFLGAGLTLIIVWTLAQKQGKFDRTRLLISGVIAGMFFGSAISLVMYLDHQDSLLILGTLMGNLGRIFGRTEWYLFLGLAAASLYLLYILYRRSVTLEVISGGDHYASSVGIDVARTRREIFIITSILIGVVVSYAGIIGFVGLIIPHIVRFFVPSGQKRIFLLSMWTGAIFLLFSDLLAKNLTTIELPVGVITAAIGCPFFMRLLLSKTK